MSLFGLPLVVAERAPGGFLVHIYDDRDRIIARIVLDPDATDEETEATSISACDQASAAIAEGSAIRQAVYSGDSGRLVGVMIGGGGSGAIVISFGEPDDG